MLVHRAIGFVCKRCCNVTPCNGNGLKGGDATFHLTVLFTARLQLLPGTAGKPCGTC
jgi:hypothetical protein